MDDDAAGGGARGGRPLARRPAQRIAVDLPAPEALNVPTLDAALALDPDVLCMAHLDLRADAERLANTGLHTVAGASSALPFKDLHHTLLNVQA